MICNDFTVAVLSSCCLKNVVNNLSQKLVAYSKQYLNFISTELCIGWTGSVPSWEMSDIAQGFLLESGRFHGSHIFLWWESLQGTVYSWPKVGMQERTQKHLFPLVSSSIIHTLLLLSSVHILLIKRNHASKSWQIRKNTIACLVEYKKPRRSGLIKFIYYRLRYQTKTCMIVCFIHYNERYCVKTGGLINHTYYSGRY